RADYGSTRGGAVGELPRMQAAEGRDTSAQWRTVVELQRNFMARAGENEYQTLAPEGNTPCLCHTRVKPQQTQLRASERGYPGPGHAGDTLHPGRLAERFQTRSQTCAFFS